METRRAWVISYMFMYRVEQYDLRHVGDVWEAPGGFTYDDDELYETEAEAVEAALAQCRTNLGYLERQARRCQLTVLEAGVSDIVWNITVWKEGRTWYGDIVSWFDSPSIYRATSKADLFRQLRDKVGEDTGKLAKVRRDTLQSSTNIQEDASGR
jgi:hypothetical protein